MEKVHDEDEMQIDLRELLFALKKRILIIFAGFLGGAAVAAAYTQLMVTPLYSSTAKLLVLPKETTLTSLADLQLGSQLASDYSVLLTSRPVLQETVDNLDLNTGYGTLRSMISVVNPTDTRILEVTVTNPDPEMAKTIVNELADVSADYIGEQMEVVPPKVIEEGVVPSAPTSPDVTRNTALGALAGLVISAGIIVLRTIMNDTIRSEDDIEKYLGIPTLAVIPDRKDYISDRSSNHKKKKRRKRRK